MKNIKKLLGVLAIALFVLVGCGEKSRLTEEQLNKYQEHTADFDRYIEIQKERANQPSTTKGNVVSAHHQELSIRSVLMRFYEDIGYDDRANDNGNFSPEVYEELEKELIEEDFAVFSKMYNQYKEMEDIHREIKSKMVEDPEPEKPKEGTMDEETKQQLRELMEQKKQIDSAKKALEEFNEEIDKLKKEAGHE
ncbi:hypothetical protein [Dolosigranulum pigrum]|uniref:hypothetical protein n=1 Tax=Dolosigranulum pigrum TaxID=29394 RepID=UPI000DC5C96D|nr:hypothetical protein [Dolosigranulum pigrum]QJS96478.1 hypothetical protein B5772_06000 [Dolosigranulum pigrum]QTJ32875.1 hypothetical protein FE321_04310 [Dolosigranulum pigrum]